MNINDFIIDWVNSSFTISLYYDKLPTNLRQGDLALFNGEYYIYYDNTWIKQNTGSREEERPKEKKKEVMQLSCKNCGAPLNINIHHCEYCGSWINIEIY